jgi:uncharacterized membrane protein
VVLNLDETRQDDLEGVTTRMLGWSLLFVVAIVVFLIGVVFVVGACLRESYEVTRSATIPAHIDEVWGVIIDFANQPTWRPSVKRVERVEDPKGDVWREAAGGDPIQFRTLKADAPSRLVRAIVGDNLPFSGRWEIRLEPLEERCGVTIVERAEIANPFFRFAARFVFGHAANAEVYLNDLARKFGVEPPFAR